MMPLAQGPGPFGQRLEKEKKASLVSSTRSFMVRRLDQKTMPAIELLVILLIRGIEAFRQLLFKV